MTDQMLTPPKKRSSFSPVLIELTIVILFFALSASVIVRLITVANATARASEYESRAILAMETVAEQVKADPIGDNTCNECGARVFSVEIDEDLAVDCVVTSDNSPLQGTLYDIELTVTSPQGKVYALDAVRYLPDAEVAP
ncbi:MAG: hypothetical protein CVV04_13785 [Firmicutes bacterium HGW-Firmicutes-9]|jgi:hypothetical protein|nr:MAG: hypothetical protein CVV04_13785 [Firmicutes bacterium HGW-Firmicutes-9]